VSKSEVGVGGVGEGGWGSTKVSHCLLQKLLCELLLVHLVLHIQVEVQPRVGRSLQQGPASGSMNQGSREWGVREGAHGKRIWKRTIKTSENQGDVNVVNMNHIHPGGLREWRVPVDSSPRLTDAAS
jgi:hypothetical protein